jgi:chorismate mutase
MTTDEARARLDEFRVLIDDIDRRIVELINERTRVVEEIGRIKREAQLPVYEPKREEQVFANITSTNRGPIPADSVRRIFERIIDEMRTLQRRKISPHPEDPKC